MAENTFKSALQRGDTVIGLWLALASAYTAEICAGAGFDWLVIDGEHAPNDVRSILTQLQAAAPYLTHPIVRPPSGDAVIVKQLLDIGAQTLLIPMVETAEQARQMVAATRYPPQGIRGVGAALARASNFGRENHYLQDADANICLLVQVESASALANLDEIVRVDGVEGVFIGPADLAASMGFLGRPGQAQVQDAIREAARRIRGAGKAAGILSTDEAQAQTYLEWGYNFVAVGTDVTLLSRATTQLATRFRGGLGRSSRDEQPGGY